MKIKEQTKSKANEIGDGNIPSLILKYSLPTFIGLLVNSLYLMIDRAFIGNMTTQNSSIALASVTLCNPISMLLFAFSVWVTVGTVVSVAICNGNGDKEGADKAAHTDYLLHSFFQLLQCCWYIYL